MVKKGQSETSYPNSPDTIAELVYFVFSMDEIVTLKTF